MNSHLKIEIIDSSYLHEYGFVKSLKSVIKKAYDEKIKEFYEKKNNKHRDSGFDLFSYITSPVLEKSISINSLLTIHFNIKCCVYDDEGNSLPYYLYPRSSISKTNMRLANSVGIIDSGYRGELMAKVDIQNNSINDESSIEILGLKRFFQLCSHNLLPFASVELVNKLDETERGSGGFGSTGTS